jgi:23S rRNA pseudouridine2605 synthase
MRLNAYLARSGIASRRGADELIKAGRVKLNGRPGALNDNVSTEDKVEVDGKLISKQILRYILLYKPAGYVSTLIDTHGRPKVTDLVTLSERVVPVGRLDKDTTGALLLTNDGELTNQLMHPSFGVDKTYVAEVDGAITAGKLNKLSNGINIDGKTTAPAKASQLAASKIELVIHEGRKHQVKNMLASVGLPVKKLHRSKYGPLSLGSLKPGDWRELSADEIKRLKMVN